MSRLQVSLTMPLAGPAFPPKVGLFGMSPEDVGVQEREHADAGPCLEVTIGSVVEIGPNGPLVAEDYRAYAAGMRELASAALTVSEWAWDRANSPEVPR